MHYISVVYVADIVHWLKGNDKKSSIKYNDASILKFWSDTDI